MRMPWAKFRLEAGGERSVGHAFVQLEKMRMPVTDTEPNNFRATFAREGSNPVERKKKTCESNREELGAQLFFGIRCHVPEKGEREMNLLHPHPAHTGQMWV